MEVLIFVAAVLTNVAAVLKCAAAALIDVASVLMFTADFAIHIFADELVFGLTIVLLDSFASYGAFLGFICLIHFGIFDKATLTAFCAVEVG